MIGLAFLFSSALALRPSQVNDRPIIGILSLPLEYESYPVNGTSYISASYVKWVEAGGARVVPLLVNATTDELDALLPQLNGVLFTGGSADMFQGNSSEFTEYAETGCYIFEVVKRLNEAGHYYPLWATCLGHELIHLCVRPQSDTLGDFNGEPAYSHFVNFTKEAPRSRLLDHAGGHKVMEMSREDIALFSHAHGVSPSIYHNTSISHFFTIVATGRDHDNLEYVALTEAKSYPIYSSQFHPEKNIYEWNLTAIPHSSDAVFMSSFYSLFFVSESRRNSLHFNNQSALASSLIYNFPPFYLDRNFEQIYVF